MRHHSRPAEQELFAVLENPVDSRDIAAVATRTG